jgi:hypothetical protein
MPLPLLAVAGVSCSLGHRLRLKSWHEQFRPRAYSWEFTCHCRPVDPSVDYGLVHLFMSQVQVCFTSVDLAASSAAGTTVNSQPADYVTGSMSQRTLSEHCNIHPTAAKVQ